LIVLFTSQSALAVNRSALNSSIDISYGNVERVEHTKIDSSAGKGAVMGGVIGAASSGHHYRTQHALTGALAGGHFSRYFGRQAGRLHLFCD
jgi:outer membrane lipoprotein SlyB